MLTLEKKLTLDYVALMIQTNSNFIKLIKEKCDSEKHGYITEIVRFDVESNPYNFEGLPFIRTVVDIVSRTTHSSGNNHNILYCHKFEINNRWDGLLTHYEMPLFMAKHFVKFSTGLKDGY